MRDILPPEEVVSHISVRKRLSFAEHLNENKPVYAFFGLLMVLSGLSGFIAPTIAASALMWGWSPFLAAFLIGFLFPLSAIVGARALCSMRNRENKQLMLLQDAVAAGQTNDLEGDLHKIIDIHRKQRHIGEAEFYSRKLLAALAGAAEGKLIPKTESTDCWVSTPAYRRTWRYHLVWLFETRGRLMLSGDAVSFWSRKVEFNVRLEDVVSVTVGTHPLYMKPIPMRFLTIRFWSGADQHEVHITPGLHTATVWEVNKQVFEWKEKIENAAKQHSIAFAPVPSIEDTAHAS